MLDSSVFLTVNDESDGEHVEDSFERNLLLHHLPVYGQCSLRADLQLVLNSFFRQFLLKRLDELGHKSFPVLLGALELICYRSVLFRLCVAEVNILHFALDVVKAQLVRQRNVQHHGLQNLSFAGELRKHVERPHHFQTVGIKKNVLLEEAGAYGNGRVSAANSYDDPMYIPSPSDLGKGKISVGLGHDSKRESNSAYVDGYIQADLAAVLQDPVIRSMTRPQVEKAVEQAKRNMEKAAAELDFMAAAKYRDEMWVLQQYLKVWKM